MSRLSDDEKRVLTDRIAELEEYRHLYHLECTKVMSREAIIEQLSETELAQDNARLQAELEMVQDALRHALNDDAGWDLQAKAMIEPFNRKTFYQQHKELGRENDRLEEENTLLAEHNQTLRKIERLAKLYLEHGEPELADELDALLTGGDDANTG